VGAVAVAGPRVDSSTEIIIVRGGIDGAAAEIIICYIPPPLGHADGDHRQLAPSLATTIFCAVAELRTQLCARTEAARQGWSERDQASVPASMPAGWHGYLVLGGMERFPIKVYFFAQRCTGVTHVGVVSIGWGRCTRALRGTPRGSHREPTPSR
jgi:hypothetical protein